MEFIDGFFHAALKMDTHIHQVDLDSGLRVILALILNRPLVFLSWVDIKTFQIVVSIELYYKTNENSWKA